MDEANEHTTADGEPLPIIDLVQGDDGRIYLHIDAPCTTTVVKLTDNDIDRIRDTIQSEPTRMRTGRQPRK